MVKNLPVMQETWVISWRREWLTTQAFLPGESHGQKSLAGSCGRKELDKIEQLTLSLSFPQNNWSATPVPT